jgi:hypothetical protein
VSIVLIYECITGSTTVNRCMEFNHIFLVMEGTYNNEVISIHFILINYSKTGQMKFMKRRWQSHMCTIVSISDIQLSTDLEKGGTTSALLLLTTIAAVCAVETLNWKGAMWASFLCSWPS